MKRLYSSLFGTISSKLLIWSVFYVLLPGISQLRAQQTNLVCNTYTPLVNTTTVSAATPSSFASLSVTSSTAIGSDQFSPKTNLIDASLANAATYTFLSAGGTAFIEVKDNDATGANAYPAGSFAGFVINNTALTTLSSVSVTTYSSTSAVESQSLNSLVTASVGTGVERVGFITSKAFDRVRITFTTTGAGSVSIYYAVVQKFCPAATSLACNTSTPIINPAYPVSANNVGFPTTINPGRTGTSGVSVITVSDADNAVDADRTNYATISSLANVAGSARLSVKNQVGTFAAGTFAGFDLSSNVTAGTGLLGNITINTYVNGGSTPVQSVSGSSLLASAPLLSGTNRQTVGFVTNAAYDEVQIVLNQLVNASIGTTRIYSAIVRNFCNGPDLACNTPTIQNDAVYPVSIDLANTGLAGVACVGCSIQNTGNVIDGSASTSATIDLLTNAGSTASIAVKNQLQTYPVSTFTGFDIETQNLLTADLLRGITITLFNNGNAVQTATGSDLLVGANTSLLMNGRMRQVIGVASTAPAFNDVKITFERLAGVNTGVINVYSLLVERLCGATLTCNTTYYPRNPEFPVIINSARTGVTGTVCAGCAVSNPENLINASLTDFASLTTIANSGAQSSISVLNPVDTYPAGSLAGFVISRSTFLVNVSLLNNLTITTYNDGVLSESKTSGNLLDLTLLFNIFGTGNNTTYNIGFKTNKPFDEMRISVGALGNVNQYVDIYSAFVDTRVAFGGNLRCFKPNPDFAVTLKNVPVTGSVQTNDIVSTGTRYTAYPNPITSPQGSTPTLTVNPDGTYSFSTATPGTYTYQVTVCPPNETTACANSSFTITVLDPTVITNPPVANVDYASVQSSATTPASITVNVTANDGPGDTGGVLNTPQITTTPARGIASIDPVTGQLVYTPAANYFGLDSLTYQVCESPGGRCASAQVIITILDPGTSTVTIVDDYKSTAQHSAVSGTVLPNDEGTGLTVFNAGTYTVPGKGTLVLTSTGEYTFTPTRDAMGPVSFTYSACDNSATAVCGTATLHVLVVPTPDLTPILYARPSSINGTTNITVVIDVLEVNNVVTTKPVTVYISKDNVCRLTFPTMATSIGNRSVQNEAWTFDDTDESFYKLTTKSNRVVNAGSQLSIGLEGTVTPGSTAGVLTISAVIVANSGGEVRVTNNMDADKINYFQQ